MFDVGFWELVLVGVVGLVVIGPERLPGVVRVTGFWLGKARRTIATVKQEIKDELYAEELRRTLSKNSPAAELHNLINETSRILEQSVDVHKDRVVRPPTEAQLNIKPSDPD